MGIQAADGVQHQGGVGHVTGNGPHLIQGGGERHAAVPGDPAVGGFQPHTAVEESRLPDGTAGIGAQGPDGFPGCNAGCAAAGRTARYTGQIPGVVGNLEMRGFRGGPHGEFIHVGLAQEDGLIFPQVFNDMGIVHRHEVFQDLGSAGHPYALHADIVLDGAGDPGQGFDGFAVSDHLIHFGCLGQGIFLVQGNIGLDLIFHFVDPVIDRFGQFHGADFFFDQLVMELMCSFTV